MDIITLIAGIVASVLGIWAGTLQLLDYRQKSLRRKQIQNPSSPSNEGIDLLKDRQTLSAHSNPSYPLKESHDALIQRILSPKGEAKESTIDKWHTHMRRSLVFPFESSLRAEFATHDAIKWHSATVRRILPPSTQDGLIAQVVADGAIQEIPLHYLEVPSISSPHHDLLDAYHYWFHQMSKDYTASVTVRKRDPNEP